MTEIANSAIKLWRERPDAMVEQLFEVTPDDWQRDVLQAFPTQKRIAMRASKGPGKTCTLAWLAWNFLLTRPYPKIAATSITADNLADGLWTEMAKWQQKAPILQQMFAWGKTRIESKESPQTWFMSARPWSRSATTEEQGLTFAGFRADYTLFLLDESGSIPQSVMVTAEAVLASGKECHIVQAGNTTQLDGPLYRACTVERNLWFISDINGDPDNPKRSSRVNIEWARDLIKSYGRDHPYVMVNVLGQFPPSAFNSLIGVQEVEAAMQRTYKPYEFADAARVLGVDVAREGADASKIYPRQGLQAYTPFVYRNIDGTQGANLVARKWKDWNADACFVDNTGGFGSSWVDNLQRLGFAPIAVNFSQKSDNPRYHNKRTEMIFELVEWIKRGGALPPDDRDIVAELTQSTYTFQKQSDKLIIEPKELLKEKIGRSSDSLDSLALTFASPVLKRSLSPQMTRETEYEYQPFTVEKAGGTPYGQQGRLNAQVDQYDPFGRGRWHG